MAPRLQGLVLHVRAVRVGHVVVEPDLPPFPPPSATPEGRSLASEIASAAAASPGAASVRVHVHTILYTAAP